MERLHALRLVVEHLVGARDLALARLGARRSLGAIDGAPRRLLRLRLRRASGFFVLAARLFDTPSDGGAGHEKRFVTPTKGGTLCQRGSFGAETPNASFVASFVAAGCSFRLVSSRLVQMGIRGSVATRAARRLRTSRVFGHRPARASLRALRCARSSSRVSGVMVASRSCAWDGAWLGQGGMTKAETDARWLTGRTRAANPGGRRTCSRMRASSLDDKMTGPMAADAAWRRGRGRECALVSGSHSVDVSRRREKVDAAARVRDAEQVSKKS